MSDTLIWIKFEVLLFTTSKIRDSDILAVGVEIVKNYPFPYFCDVHFLSVHFDEMQYLGVCSKRHPYRLKNKINWRIPLQKRCFEHRLKYGKPSKLEKLINQTNFRNS